jgi:hypothetical protein
MEAEIRDPCSEDTDDHIGDLLGEAFAHALEEPEEHQGRVGDRQSERPEGTVLVKYRDIGDMSPGDELKLHIPQAVDERGRHSFTPAPKDTAAAAGEVGDQGKEETKPPGFGGWFSTSKADANSGAGAGTVAELNARARGVEEPGVFSNFLACLPMVTPTSAKQKKLPRPISHSKLKPVSPDPDTPSVRLEELLGTDRSSWIDPADATDDHRTHACRLQSVWRGKALRNEHKEMHDKALVVQDFWRSKGRWKAMYSVIRVVIAHHRACTVIQRRWRGRNVRGIVQMVVIAAPKLCTPHTIKWLSLVGHEVLNPGVEVLAQYGNPHHSGDSQYYRATVVDNNGDGTYHLHYEGGSEWRATPAALIKMDVAGADLEPECFLEANDVPIARSDGISEEGGLEFVYQNHVWTPFQGWGDKGLRRPWSSEDGQQGARSFEAYKHVKLDEYIVVKDQYTDRNGWQYAVSFDALDWHVQCFRSACARRRRWADRRLLPDDKHASMSMDQLVTRATQNARVKVSFSDIALALDDRTVKARARKQLQQETWQKQRDECEVMRHKLVSQAMVTAKHRLRGAVKKMLSWWIMLCILTTVAVGIFSAVNATTVWGAGGIDPLMNITTIVSIPTPVPTPVPTWINGSWGASADNVSAVVDPIGRATKTTWTLRNWCEGINLDKAVRSPWGGYSSLVFFYCGLAVFCLATVGEKMHAPIRTDQNGEVVEPHCCHTQFGCCFGTGAAPEEHHGQRRPSESEHHSQYRRQQGPVGSNEENDTEMLGGLLSAANAQATSSARGTGGGTKGGPTSPTAAPWAPFAMRIRSPPGRLHLSQCATSGRVLEQLEHQWSHRNHMHQYPMLSYIQASLLIWMGIACFVAHAEGGSTWKARLLERTSVWALVLFQAALLYLALFVRCPASTRSYRKTIFWYLFVTALFFLFHFCLEFAALSGNGAYAGNHLEKYWQPAVGVGILLMASLPRRTQTAIIDSACCCLSPNAEEAEDEEGMRLAQERLGKGTGKGYEVPEKGAKMEEGRVIGGLSINKISARKKDGPLLQLERSSTGPTSPTARTATMTSLKHGTDEFVTNHPTQLNVHLTALARSYHLQNVCGGCPRTGIHMSLGLGIVAFILRRPMDYGMSCRADDAWYVQAHGYWHIFIALSASLAWWVRWTQEARHVPPAGKDAEAEAFGLGDAMSSHSLMKPTGSRVAASPGDLASRDNSGTKSSDERHHQENREGYV